jgi:hypothetical protein
LTQCSPHGLEFASLTLNVRQCSPHGLEFASLTLNVRQCSPHGLEFASLTLKYIRELTADPAEENVEN